MRESRLATVASRNRNTFDEVLCAYVATKLNRVPQLPPHKNQTGWLDATGCVWRLFGDEKFVRSGDSGRRLRFSVKGARRFRAPATHVAQQLYGRFWATTVA